MVSFLLGIEFLRSDIQTILYYGNDPRMFKNCLYILLILLASLYSIVAGVVLYPEPVLIYELMPEFQIGKNELLCSFREWQMKKNKIQNIVCDIQNKSYLCNLRVILKIHYRNHKHSVLC